MTILKEIRESSKLSVTELSKLSGVHRRTIYNLETGTQGVESTNFYKIIDSLASFVDKAYIAGLVDRSSTISITKIKPFTQSPTQFHDAYVAKFLVHSIHKEIPEIIKRVLGVGKVSKRKDPKGDPYYCFYAHHKNAGEALEVILPYLKIKRKKAQILLDFREQAKLNIKKRGSNLGNHKVNDWSQEEANKVYEDFYRQIREA